MENNLCVMALYSIEKIGEDKIFKKKIQIKNNDTHNKTLLTWIPPIFFHLKFALNSKAKF
jgi:hypothetical protein